MDAGPLVAILNELARSEPVTWVLLYMIFRELRRPPGSAFPTDPDDRQEGA